MAGPALVIVAGAVTLWLAIKSNDGLVADDYYKQGLAINQTLAREERAIALGLTADVRLGDERIDVRLTSRVTLPERVYVTLSHPTRSGLDHRLVLSGSGGVYSGAIARLQPGRWQLEIADDGNTWRLSGVLHVPEEHEVRIAPAER